MNQRGEYGRRTHHSSGRGTYVGKYAGALGMHTVGDRDALVEQTMTGWQRLVSEFITKMGGNPKDFALDTAAMARDPAGWATRLKAANDKLEKSPLYPFWRDVISPEYDAFKKFYADQSSWEEWKTDWSTYVNWSDRLDAMRDSVNKVLATQNIAPLAGPGTVPLGPTITEKGGEALGEGGKLLKRGAEGAGEIVMDTAKVAKYALIGAIVIGGAVVLTSVASHLRKGTDPIEKYADIARRNARAAGTALALKGA